MRGFTLLGKEFAAIAKNKKILIPIIAVLFIPVLYAGMFLWAFWDPYARLDHIPVAVVNLDKGTEQDGGRLEVGDELVENLRENDKFKWEFVSEEKGRDGLKNQKYYMMVLIPEGFSKNATTLLEDHPERLQLQYIPNESFNFLSAQIGGTAVDKIKEEVSNTLTKTYAEKMFASVGDVSKGLSNAADGAKQLHDGSLHAYDGSKQVTDGLQTAKAKTNELSGGVGQLYDGSQELTNKLGELHIGASRVYDGSKRVAGGLQELARPDGRFQQSANQLESGSQQLAGSISGFQGAMNTFSQSMEKFNSQLPGLAEGSQQLAEGANQLYGGAHEVTEGLQQLNQQLAALPEPYRTQLQGAVQELAAGSGQVEQGIAGLSEGAGQLHAGHTALAEGFGRLQAGQGQLAGYAAKLTEGSAKLSQGLHDFTANANQGIEQLASGAEEVTGGLSRVKAGAEKAQAGSDQILGGLGKASDGTKQLASGVEQLADGSGQIQDGLAKISDGTDELAVKLGDAAKETGDVKGSDEKYDMFAEPVQVKTEKIAEVPNYGTGFAPYFLSLGLFVGALLLSIVFPLRETVGTPKSGFSWFISKFGVLLLVGIIQAVVADLILLLGLGIEVQSVSLFILFSILTSLTFIALVQFLVTALSDAGRFIAIIILILQLTTSAGTFPLELIPVQLQGFSLWLPMTYSVSGFKAVISSGNYDFMWQNAAVLAGYVVLTAAGTIAVLSVIHKRYFGRLEAK